MQKENQTIFEQVIIGLSEKLNKTPETIFEGTDFVAEIQTIEESFYANVSEFNYMNMKPYDQRKAVKEFFEGTYLSQVYTYIYDTLLTEGDLTFSQQYLLENTEKLFNVSYMGSRDNCNSDIVMLEESFFSSTALGATAVSIGLFLGMPLLPIVALTIPTVFAIELLTPIASSAKTEKIAALWLGNIGKLLVSSKPFYMKGSSPISQSVTNVANFDNLNLNEDVVDLFHKLQRSSNKKDVVSGIEEIFGKCNDTIMNSIQNDPNIDLEKLEDLKNTKYNPAFASILGMLYNNIMKSANAGGQTDQILTYRKCIIDKLTDIYKYLVISNAVNSKDYLKIARSLSNGHAGNTEQLFSFVASASENDQSNTTELLRENLITLLKLRLEFDNLASGLNRGAFKIDTESGKYFQQKLKQTDIAIEDYLRTHGRKVDTLYETRRDFEKKDFKHNPVNVKRSIFGFDRGSNGNRSSNAGQVSTNNPPRIGYSNNNGGYRS